MLAFSENNIFYNPGKLTQEMTRRCQLWSVLGKKRAGTMSGSKNECQYINPFYKERGKKQGFGLFNRDLFLFKGVVTYGFNGLIKRSVDCINNLEHGVVSKHVLGKACL